MTQQQPEPKQPGKAQRWLGTIRAKFTPKKHKPFPDQPNYPEPPGRQPK
jgi:hypothetical protein